MEENESNYETKNKSRLIRPTRKERNFKINQFSIKYSFIEVTNRTFCDCTRWYDVLEMKIRNVGPIFCMRVL